MWDSIQKDYFAKRNLEIDASGVVKIPRSAWAKEIYRGFNCGTGEHNWMIPSENGCCLIFEHRHFEIV